MKRIDCLCWSAVFITMTAWFAWTGGSGFSRNASAQVREQIDSGDKDGVEILTQGPVHEAFAQPGTGRLGATLIVPKKPPEPIEELPPDERPDGDSIVWISGYWAWDIDRTDFIWVSGLWRNEPAGKDWVPGYWDDEDDGWRWVSGYWGEEAQAEVELLPPPPQAIIEAPPPQVVEESSYSPGTWVYREHRYLWRPGFWVGHRPGWMWCNATYVWTPGGYVFVDSHWDYDYQRRGLLFAPAYFQPRFFAAGQRFVYRPYYAINSDLLLTSLFVRSAANHFVFGDYFDARYSRLGYTSWVDFRVRGRWRDPAFDYYRWRHRDNPGWERNLQNHYVEARQNVNIRPPRTLVEQQRRATVKGGTQVNLVNSLNNVQTTNINIKLKQVTKIEIQNIQKTVKQSQTLQQSRVKMESHARAQDSDKGEQRAVKIQLSKATGPDRPKRSIQAPPLPTVPKHQAKPPAGAKHDDDEGPNPPPRKRIDNPGKKGGPAPKEIRPKGNDSDPPRKVETKQPPVEKKAPPQVEKKAPPVEKKAPPQVEKKAPPVEKKAPPPPPSKGKKKDDDQQAMARTIVPNCLVMNRFEWLDRRALHNSANAYDCS